MMLVTDERETNINNRPEFNKWAGEGGYRSERTFPETEGPFRKKIFKKRNSSVQVKRGSLMISDITTKDRYRKAPGSHLWQCCFPCLPAC